jgi:hypothetical protein
MEKPTNTVQTVERIILANPRKDVPEELLAEVVEAGRVAITAIPGVEAMSFGVALAADAAYQWYVRIRFRDEQALDVYQTHPNHTNFGTQQWLPVIADQIVLDYRLQY